MNKEQYDKLIEFEKVFERAVKYNFLHLSKGEFATIAEVYNEIFPPLPKNKYQCGSCRLDAVKKLGNEFFNFKENIEVTPVETQETQEVSVETQEVSSEYQETQNRLVLVDKRQTNETLATDKTETKKRGRKSKK